MSVTIYHNPRCSKSRQALQILNDNGIEPEVKEYLKDGLTRDEVEALFEALGLDSAHSMIRTKEAEYAQADLSKDSTNSEIFDALLQSPKLLERPIVITDKGTRICRPPALVEGII